ncbi:MAG: LPS assembly lipoprotein LptE [Lysobacter sp.]
MIRRLLPLVLTLALSACGFQLRNALTLPAELDPIKVVSTSRYSPLADSLSQALVRAGATSATADTSAPAVLRIMAERWGDSPVSVDSRGRAQEFSLRYAVVFELRNGDGTVLVPEQNIELSRDYISVPNNSIGTEGERDILMREMQREMAASVMRRIGAATGAERVTGDPSKVFIRTTDAAKAAMEAADALAPPPAQPVPEPEPEPEPVLPPSAADDTGTKPTHGHPR